MSATSRDSSVTPEFAPLGRLFQARTIAIVGASADLDKIGGRPLRYLAAAGFEGTVVPVNPRYERIGDLPCSPTVSAIGESVDMAIIAVSAAAVPDAIDDCAAAGVPFAVVFSSGFAETGADGREAQRNLVDRARRGGVRLVGPNSLGVASAPNRLTASFATLFDRHPRPVDGNVGFISQSGALGVFIYAMAQDRGLGFSRFVSIGNESDLDVADFVAYMADDDETAVIGGYLEGLADGRRFLAAAQRARNAGKPMAFLKVGRSEAGRRAAASHTGSLAGSDVVNAAAFRQAGIVRVADPQSLVDFLRFHRPRPAVADRGRVAVLTISGGAGVWTADRLADLGSELAEFTPETVERLTAVLPSFASASNPLDATGQIVNDPSMFDSCLDILRSDPGVGTIVVILGLQDRSGDRFAERIVAARDASPEVDVVVAWLAGPRSALEILEAAHVPAFDDLHRAVDFVGSSVAARRVAASAPLAGDSVADANVACDVAIERPSGASSTLTEVVSKEILGRIGVGMPEGRLCTTRDEAVGVAVAAGRRVVAKAQVEGVAHKTEHALVELGLDGTSIGDAFDRLVLAADRQAGERRGVLVEEMVDGGVDVIVGCVTDDVFGPTVMFGLGGVMVEVFGDVSFRVAPVTIAEAHEMIDETAGSKLLAGFRGSPPLDRSALAEIICSVSRFAVANASWVREVEINPVRVLPVGAVALDALIITKERDNR